jgi:hypothetical protein
MSVNMRRRLGALALFVVAFVALGAPVLLAVTRSHPRLDAAQREAVVTDARAFFDNPMERLLQLSYSVTDSVPGAEPQCPWLVEAFSLFGISAGRVLIECDGDAQRA